jgi:hypothetical protein
MTISLDAGRIQTGDFGINLREKFQVYILLDPSIDDYWTDGRCNFDSLPEMNWKVFQLPNQERSEFWIGSESRRSSEGYVGEFHAVPGTYRFELQISKATRCLNVRHPHLQISTPSRDYAEIYNCLLYLWLFVAGLGAVLVLIGICGWKRERLSILSATPIFPETPLRNVIALKRHRPMLVIRDLRMFGPTWFAVIAALSVVLLLYLTRPMMRYGLPIDFPKHYAAGRQEPVAGDGGSVRRRASKISREWRTHQARKPGAKAERRIESAHCRDGVCRGGSRFCVRRHSARDGYDSRAGSEGVLDYTENARGMV